MIQRHPLIAGVGVVALVALAIFVLAYFEPQKLVVEERVDEALPALGGGAARSPRQPGTRSPARILSAGSFGSFEHETTGRARVVRLADGSRLLRLDRLSTSNGPDLRVYLSATPAADPSGSFDRDFVELGSLKGNMGSQNYRVPSGVRLERFRSAVVWCKRFSVAFGAAPLR